MLVTIHLRSASQQCLVVALMALPTIESHMVPYKYTRKAFQQFPCTFAGDSPKWNILVVTWALVICLKYTHLHSGCALVLVCIFQANHSYPCYNYYLTPQLSKYQKVIVNRAMHIITCFINSCSDNCLVPENLYITYHNIELTVTFPRQTYAYILFIVA